MDPKKRVILTAEVGKISQVSTVLKTIIGTEFVKITSDNLQIINTSKWQQYLTRTHQSSFYQVLASVSANLLRHTYILLKISF